MFISDERERLWITIFFYRNVFTAVTIAETQVH